MSKNEQKLLIIPLGGIGEIGKNMTVIQYEKEILVIDAGLMFPEEEMLGVDMVIPDITYLVENKDFIKGIIITHGHEDHIGALPYVLQQINAPLYGTRLTMGLVEVKLKETKFKKNIAINVIKPPASVKIGNFTVDFFRVNHSIPDSVGVAIYTPVGTVCHTGDFKFDQTPVDGKIADLHKLAELGTKGVLALLSDSTNAERQGYTMSERVVGSTIEEIFGRAKGRIIVATFASNIHRIQQVIDAAFKFGRKVAVVGRSMVNVVNIALNLGYLSIPKDLLMELDDIQKLPNEKVVIITTGSQGEPMSALTRMAMCEHKKVEIIPGDTVLIAATPIPGNEKFVARTIDHLFKQGAEVIYEAISGVHVSGHASQEELKLMLNLVKPKYFIPVHGEYRHLIHHANLAKEVGIPEGNIFIPENGRIVELTKDSARLAGKVTAGKVMVDGLGVGDVGNIVLRDRKQLAQDGILIVVVTIDKETTEVVAGPDIISRGFVYVRESEVLMEQSREIVRQALRKCQEEEITEWSTIKSQVRDTLGKFLFEQTRRRPMILPIIMEV
ncbi:ribonuclease J [Thermosediminibacter oceani]|uniref:Ribonuclease J n=1 Tax=Thermosediminibacter oceani (strain ATCC BAA-1034 / DSM 16646 / JW/IW-1228P) TaxID=555079 RepID=D9S3K6_THEOJ|nr:ribonuclease J [Thermosediminibacter oceani]ADL07983.1 RNA-metabolising metallo-beta-lactamase [Thermosediminibacter oceani DSM 16646]